MYNRIIVYLLPINRVFTLFMKFMRLLTLLVICIVGLFSHPKIKHRNFYLSLSELLGVNSISLINKGFLIYKCIHKKPCK